VAKQLLKTTRKTVAQIKWLKREMLDLADALSY